MMLRETLFASFLAAMAVAAASAADGNRLGYLDEFLDPYWPQPATARLTTPQWVGEAGVEAVIVLSIDDLSRTRIPAYEQFLRPIIDRLKEIDGRGPVSIMARDVDPDHPLLKHWLREGVSVEAHTLTHPCPCLQRGDLPAGKKTYDESVDQVSEIPGTGPVGFRMPCCDSMNSVSPRFFTEIFNRRTPAGNFLRIDSSVFNLTTPADPDLARTTVFEADGRQRFRKYLPLDRDFANFIEDYPYPFVIGRLCWELPMSVPSDWEAFHHHGSANPQTLEDWKAAVDATVRKQGAQSIIFHPHGWIRNEQVVELIDYAVATYGQRIKFLSVAEVHQRLTENLLGGHALRADDGEDNGVRVLDVNADGFMDVVVGNDSARETRVWSPAGRAWRTTPFPASIVSVGAQGVRCETGVRFGVLQADGAASFMVSNGERAGLWHFRDGHWAPAPLGLNGLTIDGAPVRTLSAGCDGGVRLRDLDADGVCELVAGHPQQNGVFAFNANEGGWRPLPFRLPEGTTVVDSRGRDAGLRWVDVDVDGRPDVVFSNAERYAVHLFSSLEKGWAYTVLQGRRDEERDDAIPPIVRADGSNNGAWFNRRHMWVQNEETGARLKNHVDKRHFTDLLGTDRHPPSRSPDSSLRSIEVLPGFRVEMVACEPLVTDPVDLAWGPDGKLWVIEMRDYPLGEDGRGKPCGRVRFLLDDDGDGRYDSSQVFLEPIAYPTGVMPWRNGVLITAAPEVFYAEDTDGDGRADVRKTLFSGFGEGNQQHRTNHPRWGLDNRVHVANGDSDGQVRSAKTGQVVDIRGRDLRFNPDDGRLDPQTGRSQFGRNRDDWGNWFGCNNPNPGWYYATADHYLRRNPHLAAPPGKVDVTADRMVYPTGRVISHCDLKHRPHAAWGQPGRWTSIGGVTIYRDDLFGSHFTGNLFVNDSVFNVIHRRVLRPRGTTFLGERGPDEQDREFLASNDIWFRNAGLSTGPDGALWVVDMCRFVIEHPEWIHDDLEKTLDLRAGHDKGRIYRIFPVDKQPRPIPRLDQLDTAGLVAALDSPSGWQRDMAHQMLLWKNDPVAVALLERTAQQCDRPQARLHALCVLDGLGGLSANIAARSLKDPHPGVRRHAVRLSESLVDEAPQVGQALLALAGDPNPQVSLQLAYSLGEWDDPQAGKLLGHLLIRHFDEPYIRAAALSSATPHLAEIARAIVSNRESLPLSRQATVLADLLRMAAAQQDNEALGNLLETVCRPAPNGYESWQFATIGDFLDDLSRRNTSLWDVLSRSPDAGNGADEAVRRLFAAARQISASDEAAGADRILAVRLLARDPDHHDEDIKLLQRTLSPQLPVDVQLASIDCLRRIDTQDVPQRLLADWATHTPRVHAAAVDVLLSREAWTLALLDRVADDERLAASLGTSRRDLLLHHRTAGIRDRARELFAARQVTDRIRGSLEKFQPVVGMQGDPARGKALFKELTCGDCHQFGGVGNAIATDLTTLLDKSPAALLTAVIDPNRAVEDKYLQYTIVTADGLMYTGMLLEETGNHIKLADQAGKIHTLLRRDIDELVSSGRSHMAEGLEEKMTLQQAADLFAFIGQTKSIAKSFSGNSPSLVAPADDGSLQLDAATAEIYGPSLIFEREYQNLGFWQSSADRAEWSLHVEKKCDYEVRLNWACPQQLAGKRFRLQVAGQSLLGTVGATGAWSNYRELNIGTVQLEAGDHRLGVRSADEIKAPLFDLRAVVLKPVVP